MLKQVVDFPGYMISELGELYHKGRKLKPSIQPNGYVKVHLYKDGKRHMRYLHRIVAEAFVPNLLCLQEVNHINKDKQDCRADNLEWVTRQYNMAHGKGRAVAQIRNGEVVKIYSTITGAAHAMNDKSHGANIVRCINRLRPHAYGFSWKYAD